MSKISISYRRRDSDAISGRIFDRLVTYYGTESVFRDIDNIPPGVDFRKYIGDALGSTDVLLAIVGPQWLAKTDGRPRIEDATDLVRIEIEAALKKGIPVVPVLVGNATMPEPSELPEGLKDFAFRNAVKVDALEDFDDHIKRLIRSLDRLLDDPARQPSAAPVPPPPSRDRDAPTREKPASDGTRLGAQERAAPIPPTPKPEPQRPIEPTAPIRSEEFAGGRTMPRISPLLGMPVLVIVLYALVYVTGGWTFGQAQGFAPAAPLGQAVLFVACVAWYGRTGLGPALLGGALLLGAASALTLANGFINSAIISSGLATSVRTVVFTLIGLINSAIYVAIFMAIASRLCPVLRQAHFWLIALIAYPIFSLVVNAAVPLLVTLQSSSRETLTAAFFVTYVLRQLALYTCLGAWVDRLRTDVPDVFS